MKFLLVEKDSIEKYKCQMCHGLMKQPIQTFRGNLACLLCYNIDERTDGLCPIDQQPITRKEYFRDKAKEKEIGRLECICGNHEKGCTWKGTIQKFENHHCTYISTECEYCHDKYEKENEIDHLKECAGIFVTGECIFKDLGCPFKADTRAVMDKHLQEDSIAHFLYQKRHDQHMEIANTEIRKMNDQLQKQNKALSAQIEDLQKTVRNSNHKIESLQTETNKKFTVLMQKLNEAVSSSNTTTNNNIGASNNSNNNSNNTTSTTGLTKEVANIVKKNIGSINELDLRLQLHENTTHDGRVLWKIDQFKKRRQDALLGKVSALHSAPCFTNQYGYKFCTRLYMNGDGMGKGTHLSLFIVLMKSEYDSLLEWPFQKQISFTLVNQVDQKKNTTEKLQPHKDSSSFQRPVKDMNVASGCPLFANLETLEKQGFVKDDCLFIEITAQ